MACAKGVAQIQDSPHAVFFSIFSHHRCFDLAGPQCKRVTRFNFCRKQCIPVITNKSQEVRISEQPVLQGLRQAAPSLAIGE